MYTISYKTKNSLIEKLENENLVKPMDKKSFFSKMFSSKEYANIYFHSGILDNEAIENINNAKLIVSNSNSAKDEIIAQTLIDEEKILTVYPSIDIEYQKTKEIKESFCQKHNLDKKRKFIFFTAKNLKSSGVKEFLDLIISLSFENFQVIIAGEKNQIYNLKFQISKYNFGDRLLLLEDYENIDEIFLASDIFILPTNNKNIASNILKAMFCKCAVFTTRINAASELIDIFSTMETPDDRSMQFKVDALLQNKDDLKLIKKQNRKIAKEYTLENNFKKFEKYLSKLDN